MSEDIRERVCAHGERHPLAADLAFVRAYFPHGEKIAAWHETHVCDGCCTPVTVPS